MVARVVITISTGDDVDADSERAGDGGDHYRNGDDVDADSERGDEGDDHYQRWR